MLLKKYNLGQCSHHPLQGFKAYELVLVLNKPPSNSYPINVIFNVIKDKIET